MKRITLLFILLAAAVSAQIDNRQSITYSLELAPGEDYMVITGSDSAQYYVAYDDLVGIRLQGDSLCVGNSCVVISDSMIVVGAGGTEIPLFTNGDFVDSLSSDIGLDFISSTGGIEIMPEGSPGVLDFNPEAIRVEDPISSTDSEINNGQLWEMTSDGASINLMHSSTPTGMKTNFETSVINVIDGVNGSSGSTNNGETWDILSASESILVEHENTAFGLRTNLNVNWAEMPTMTLLPITLTSSTSAQDIELGDQWNFSSTDDAIGFNHFLAGGGLNTRLTIDWNKAPFISNYYDIFGERIVDTVHSQKVSNKTAVAGVYDIEFHDGNDASFVLSSDIEINVYDIPDGYGGELFIVQDSPVHLVEASFFINDIDTLSEVVTSQHDFICDDPYSGTAIEYHRIGDQVILDYQFAPTPIRLDVETPPFLPTDIADLAVWYDGADSDGDGVLNNTSGAMATWVDKSGNGVNLTGVSSPQIAIAQLNGNSIIKFQAGSYATDQGVNANHFDFLHQTASDVFVIWRHPTVHQSPAHILATTGPSSAQVGFVLWHENRTSIGDDAIQIRLSNGIGGNLVINHLGNNQVLVSDWNTVNTSIDLNDSQRLIYDINGVSYTPVNSSSSPSLGSSTNRFRIGSKWDFVHPQYVDVEIEIAEVIIYNGRLTPAERSQIEAYLNNKWGI